MEQLSRVRLYQKLAQKNISERLVTVLRVNISVLLGVEELFLTPDEGTEISEPDFTQLSSRIRNNIDGLGRNNLVWFDDSVSKLKDNILKMIEDYEKKDYVLKGIEDNQRKEKATRISARNLFNKLINSLAKYNERMLDSNVEFERRDRREGMPQVFLSHAYDDKAYSLALFDYFYEQGIYLYVGWMHNEIEVDGRVVKKCYRFGWMSQNSCYFLGHLIASWIFKANRCCVLGVLGN